MAEATPSTTSSGAPTPSASSSAPKQYIKASTDDDALEPDAMRGSEHLLKDTPIQDDEADRRKKVEGDKK